MASFKTAVERRKPVLFVYAERDYLWQEFDGYFLSQPHGTPPPFDVVTVPDANHSFTENACQRDLENAIVAWMESRRWS